jgi:hypothetical protein
MPVHGANTTGSLFFSSLLGHIHVHGGVAGLIVIGIPRQRISGFRVPFNPTLSPSLCQTSN